ncbi:MAG: PQQ-dependent sugar dehydrogenase [Gemmatimonadota bacterium]
MRSLRSRCRPSFRLGLLLTFLGSAAPTWSACGGGTAAPPPGNGGGQGGGGGDGPQLGVQVVAQGLDGPVHLTSPPGDQRLFVVEQPGRIRLIEGGALQALPFLDLTDRVGSGGERGLLGLAFHPQYAANGHLYVDYTDRNGNTRVERYTVSADPDRADPATAKAILQVGQPFSNHNGGLVAFGPDGKLYVGLGDGGGAGDPQGNGQNPGTLLGSLLRIDVDAGDPFAIPPDNPFVGQAGRREEIWAWGLRNPWRFAFDREADVLYIADVGQNAFEEVNAAPVAAAGLNYGWNVMEGTHCFPSGAACDTAGLTLPVLEYDHSQGCSVIGGFVYRGEAIPALRGHYFYSDFCRGFLRTFRLDGGAVDRREWEVGPLGQVLSFGEDAAGELYILSATGTVFRIVAAE